MRSKITIDVEKCSGCGLCAQTCHEGAIGIVNGKAKLLRGDFCDGLGNCLPVCPTGAISLEEEETAEHSSTNQRSLNQRSGLINWPIQIKLVPVNAPYFENADLLISADCAAYAYAAFHTDFMAGKITLIGCSKLDDGNYIEKLMEIFSRSSIKSITVVRMEVPCCGGIEYAVLEALKNSGKMISPLVATISIKGLLIKELAL